MRGILTRVKNNHWQFVNYGRRTDAPTDLFRYLQFLYYCVGYAVSVGDYFDNKLYAAGEAKDHFFLKNHKVVHRWKNVIRNYKPEAGFWWRVIHRADYTVSKLLYPGLDAMDYFRYEFYNIRHSKRKTFITEGYLRKLNEQFNHERENMEQFRILQEKAQFNTFFSEIVTRRWIRTQDVTWEDFQSFCAQLERAIAKPEDGTQGKGIFIASVKTEQEQRVLFDDLHTKKYLLEEVIVQCPEVSALNPSAVNSIRVYSVIKDNTVVITAATLRLGSGKDVTDNYSAGGFAASVDPQTGIVISRAVSQYGQGVYVHPVSGNIIIGTQIPKWKNVVSTVTYAHKKIPQLRYIGWDVVVCADGSVTFLEANTFAGVALQQHPLLEGKKPLYVSLMG